MKKLSSIFFFLIGIVTYIVLFPIAKLVYLHKNVWLFIERGFDAQDNSFYLYKWICENHNEINAVYVINKKAKDYEKVSNLGKTCNFHSIKHWLIFIASKARVTTHLYSAAPNKFIGSYFLKYRKRQSLDVFVQHGITYNYQDCFLRKNNKADLVICGAKKEYEYLVKTFDLGLNCLKLTGFPRFDTLVNKESDHRFILIQPTWRSWLSNLSTDEFKNSNYFKKWDSLLNNKNLINFLQSKNLAIHFKIHPSFNEFADLFKHPGVVLLDSDSDIQDEFCKSDMLITDYSSILFDYAYLKKPIINYLFDKNDFFSKQYHQGYFDIEKDGFGISVIDEEMLIKAIYNIVNSNFTLESKYLNRINDFYNFADNNSCRRVFNEIINKL